MTLRSMTGFGRASFEVGELAFDIELRSVNHRYLDARVKLPRLLAGFESDVRARLQARLDRGKVDLSVTSPGSGGPAPRLEVDIEAARQYLRAARDLREREDVAGEIAVAGLLALPGVARFVDPELSADLLREGLLRAVDAVLEATDAMRAREGETLLRDLSERLGRVLELVASVEARGDVVQQGVRERLRRRAEQLRQEVGLFDEARLHQEIVIAADRLDVVEELVRLRSHVDQFRSILEEAGPGKPVGRRLDFLLQEFGREANTIGSKASDAPVAHTIVELKTEIARLREQVQNLE
ncbi:MAG: YicC family protein [Myxococcales bacterium]|nr:MAG: YicC family protein [Myxococcales bacterium]